MIQGSELVDDPRVKSDGTRIPMSEWMLDHVRVNSRAKGMSMAAYIRALIMRDIHPGVEADK